MRPADTSPAAWKIYCDRLAEMSPAEKIHIAATLWEEVDTLQRAVLRKTYPDADENEIKFRLAVRRYGEELARKAYRKP